VLLPCYNEEATIGSVVKAFSETLPQAAIYVYDNNSKDKTGAVATAAGAIVRKETRQGKGNVLRRMFADIDADIYVMADGDNTYDATAAPKLVDMLIISQLDLVNGARAAPEAAAYRAGHKFGDVMLI
jgi:glycosyltransferase involved in cell wall biosynthesis